MVAMNDSMTSSVSNFLLAVRQLRSRHPPGACQPSLDAELAVVADYYSAAINGKPTEDAASVILVHSIIGRETAVSEALPRKWTPRDLAKAHFIRRLTVHM